MTMSMSMRRSHVFRCSIPCSCHGRGSSLPRNFPVIYLSGFGKFLLTPKLGKDNLYRADEIWSPYDF